MELARFEYLMTTFKNKELGQDPLEWRHYMAFVCDYFSSRGIKKPVVVEIGIWNGLQRRFYEQLMGAEYIGIDNGNPFAPISIHDGSAVADIWGDSHDPATVEKLKVKLEGRPIDLLFIDGDHSYESVKLDWNLYEPLVEHIVAFHDIYGINPKDPAGLGVYRFWDELVNAEKTRPIVIFKKDSSADWILQMGIGLLIKGK